MVFSAISPDLSWGSLLEGQRYVDLDPRAVRELAEQKLMTADASALTPISELASLNDHATQNLIYDELKLLAQLEAMPSELAYREWRAFHLQQTLQEVNSTQYSEEWDYDYAYKLSEVVEFWYAYDRPLDAPYWHYEINPHEPELWTTALAGHKHWLEREKEVVQELKHLFQTGRQAELAERLKQLADSRLGRGRGT